MTILKTIGTWALYGLGGIVALGLIALAILWAYSPGKTKSFKDENISISWITANLFFG